ncbi:MAG: hypothetical protein JW881_07285 [Spirochaetales bacterium]|nr:hypothetical protein [Spirochaetales bacterium]
MKKHSCILLLLLLFPRFFFGEINTENSLTISHEVEFDHVDHDNLVNKNNKLELKYLYDKQKINLDFNIKVPGIFLFHISPYFIGFDMEDKKSAGVNELFFKYFNTGVGLQLTAGKYIINNTSGNIFFPFNYFDNYFDFGNIYEKNFDSSVSLFNISAHLSLFLDDLSVDFSARWIPGFHFSEMADIYFLATLQNEFDRNIFQFDLGIDMFCGISFNILYAMIEKSSYDFSEGIYNVFGVSNSISFIENIILTNEMTISNGHPLYKLVFENSGSIMYDYWIEEDISTKNTRYFLDYMAGIDLLLPYDTKITFEYYYHQNGMTGEQSADLFNAMGKVYAEDNAGYLLPIQATYLAYHTGNRLKQHYIGMVVSKLNIFNTLDVRSTFIYSPFDLSFSNISYIGVNINEDINVNTNMIFNIGENKTEYGSALYDFILTICFELKLDM